MMTTTTNKLTAETITTKQIRALRTEAGAAGDAVQIALCAVALASGLADVAEIDESVRSDLEALGIIPEHVGADIAARSLCADAINDAAAADTQAVRS